jgi:hypothetical protein
VAKIKHFGITVTNQDSIHEEIKTRINSGNACYLAILSFRLLSKDVKSIVYKTIVLPVVSYECKTWSLMPREGHRLRVSENRMFRRMF